MIFFRTQLASLANEIQNEPPNELVNVNEIAYNDYLIQKFKIWSLRIFWKKEGTPSVSMC
jgi:hypothetical protein